MKIFDFAQRSPEWFEIRKGVITASRVGMFCAEPFGITYNVETIKAMLRVNEIPFKSTAKRDELIALIPNVEAHMKLMPAAQTLIDEIMGEQADGDDQPAEYVCDDCTKLTGTRFWIERGNVMEPVAVNAYLQRVAGDVWHVGFILHDCGKFGCSPDGMIYNAGALSHGLEIKCPEGKTHLRYLREGVLPDEYRCQVHASMAVTGFNRWDFFSFHPNLPPLLLTVERDDFTDQLERGLIALGEEMRRQEITLAKAWRDEFENAKTVPQGASKP